MKTDLAVKNGITVPAHELEITTSRAGGPGGQHVNRTDTRVTIRWNLLRTTALTEEQKMRALNNLQEQLTTDGDLIVSVGTSRSQHQNKEAAFEHLAHKIRAALYVPKKRMKTRVPHAAKEAILRHKHRRSFVKKLRSKKYAEE